MSYGSLQNLIQGNSKQAEPKVGDGCTEICYTDRHAGTITWVSASGKSFRFKRDIATRKDGLGMSDAQQYTYEPDPNASEHTARLHKDGKYRSGGTVVGVGYRQEYYDYSF